MHTKGFALRQGFTLTNGFTLLEIMIVMVVIGMLATITIPRFFRKTPQTDWVTITDEINNLVYYARQEAISNHQVYRLHFFAKAGEPHRVVVEIEQDDLEKAGKKIYQPIKSSYFNPVYTLPEIIEIEAVYHGKEEELGENKSEAFCYVIPNGLVQETLLHLIRTQEEKESKASLIMLPFSGKFELREGFIKPEK